MKYKVGDLVRIKSKAWWNELEKDEEGNAVFTDEYIDGEILFYHLTENRASEFCGRIGEIVKIDEGDKLLPYLIGFKNNSYWIDQDWIKEKVEKINITLWHMKNEI